MGMHYGIVAASGSQADLLAELGRHAGEFIVGDAVGSPFDAELEADNEGWLMAVGELDGKAFLLDSSFVLSSSPDMIVAMSARLGTVVGCAAETVSGTYELTVARNGDPQRFVFVCHAGMTRGMAMGEPLPTEAEHPIEDLDGDGLFAALAHVGLDATRWLTGGPAFQVRYDATRFPENGSIDAVRSEHYRRYERPQDEWRSEIQAVVREPKEQ
jgi:hypothetical protein